MTGQTIGRAIGQYDEQRSIHSPSDPAAAMIVTRLGAQRFGLAGALLCFAAMLGACAPFSGFVADHVPHWAGGLPADAPPRPGAPGYDEFIAHGEAAQNAQAPESGNAPGATPQGGAASTVPSSSAAAASAPQFQARNGKVVKVGRPAAPPVQASVQHEPQATESATPVETPSAEDPSVVKGGLY
jgi:hypothetical protein